MKTLDSLGEINIWSEQNNTMDVMVEGPRASTVAGLLHDRDVAYSVAVPDVYALYEKQATIPCSTCLSNAKSTCSSCCIAPPDLAARKMDWQRYHRLDTIYHFMDDLASEYPYLCSVETIGRTAEGRPIKLLKISNGDDDNVGVWIDGTIHAREWISCAVVTYIADQLVRKFHSLPLNVTTKDWYFLPVLNPDGYEYTHTIDRMWRKNRSRHGECNGVDLNRNFSYGWGEKGEEGSSEDPGSIFFRGPRPFSEAETIAVKHAILKAHTHFKVFISFHSYGEAIIFPWGCTSDPCPDYVVLLEGGTAIAKAIFEKTGRTYKVGSTKDLMYYAAGNSVDWSYGAANIPFSYMIELRGKESRFLLPKEEIIPTAVEQFCGVLKLLDFIERRSNDNGSCECGR